MRLRYLISLIFYKKKMNYMYQKMKSPKGIKNRIYFYYMVIIYCVTF